MVLPNMIWLPNDVFLGWVMMHRGSDDQNNGRSWNATGVILTMSLTSSRGDFIVPTADH